MHSTEPSTILHPFIHSYVHTTGQFVQCSVSVFVIWRVEMEDDLKTTYDVNVEVEVE
jgi:hypothetical protein